MSFKMKTLMRFSTQWYYKNRYRKDPEYRKKAIKAVRKWQKKNPDKVKQYRLNAKKRYKNRDEKEIERRKRYLKKYRSKKK